MENQALADELDNLDLDNIFPGCAELIEQELAQILAVNHPSSSLDGAGRIVFPLPSEIHADAKF